MNPRDPFGWPCILLRMGVDGGGLHHFIGEGIVDLPACWTKYPRVCSMPAESSRSPILTAARNDIRHFSPPPPPPLITFNDMMEGSWARKEFPQTVLSCGVLAVLNPKTIWVIFQKTKKRWRRSDDEPLFLEGHLMLVL